MSETSFTDIFTQQKRWRIIDEPICCNPIQALEQDFALLKEVAQTKRGATARIWETTQCLVATRKETRFPNFEQACQQLEQEQWPVIVRDSGGTAVPLQQGILNLAVIFPQRTDQAFDLDMVYIALCEPIKRALSNIGLKADYGSTEGSYCDGRYNLNVDGLKITGTAQKIMLSPPNNKNVKQGVLAQAMLMVDVDAETGTHWVNRFYQLAGNDRRFKPEVATSLIDLLDHTQRPEQFTAYIRALIIEELKKLTLSQ
ncbi:biotin/lipoate A/B protein ligase family protein [Neptuniibacter sp. QD37_6]|uniref:lipoate--protein ligase family protein n=1 Tax=Neptuniibacter sp. QD37_6 TaxID=3398210 RepID=UPI0039F5A06E